MRIMYAKKSKQRFLFCIYVLIKNWHFEINHWLKFVMYVLFIYTWQVKYLCFLGGLRSILYLSLHLNQLVASQIMIGHLGHFLLDFLSIWTQGTLRHILGPILVIFEICHFLTILMLFEYFPDNRCSQKSKVIPMKEQWLFPFIFCFKKPGP